MARTKDVVLVPGQKELMEKEYLDFVKPSTYGNKANPSSCNSLYDDVENPELRAIVEKVAATTPYREETSTNEAQSPPNPQKRISGKQRRQENAGNGRSAQPFSVVASQVSRLFAILRAHGFCVRALPAVLVFVMRAVLGYCKKVYSLRFEGRSLAPICACLPTPRPSEAPRTPAVSASCLCEHGF